MDGKNNSLSVTKGVKRTYMYGVRVSTSNTLKYAKFLAVSD